MKIDSEKLEKIAMKFKNEASVFEESSCCIGIIDGVSFRLQVFSQAAAEENGDEVLPELECITA
jgi:hypothetical protein